MRVPEVWISGRDQRIGRGAVAEVNVGDEFTLIKTGGRIGIGAIRFQKSKAVGDLFDRGIDRGIDRGVCRRVDPRDAHCIGNRVAIRVTAFAEGDGERAVGDRNRG